MFQGNNGIFPDFSRGKELCSHYLTKRSAAYRYDTASDFSASLQYLVTCSRHPGNRVFRIFDRIGIRESFTLQFFLSVFNRVCGTPVYRRVLFRWFDLTYYFVRKQCPSDRIFCILIQFSGLCDRCQDSRTVIRTDTRICINRRPGTNVGKTHKNLRVIMNDLSINIRKNAI